MNEEYFKQIYSQIAESLLPLFYQHFRPILQKDTASEYKLSGNQIKMLMILYLKGKQTPTNMGIFMDMPKGSLTSIIDSLEELHLLNREPHYSDRRKTILSITEKGEKYITEKKEENIKDLGILFNHLPDEEVKQFVESLKTVSEIVKKL